jgi:hypothetical protein
LMSSLNYFDYLTTGNLKSMIKELSKASPWLQKQMKTSNNGMIVDLDGGRLLGLVSKLVKPGHKTVMQLLLENWEDVEVEDMYR